MTENSSASAQAQPETQPSFGDLTRAVKMEPVYGVHLSYRADAPSPLVANLTGSVFVSTEYLEQYADEEEWVDTGAAVYEADPVMRSAMIDNGLAEPAYGGGTMHLRRTAKFVEVWNALFADLSPDVSRFGHLRHSAAHRGEQ